MVLSQAAGGGQQNGSGGETLETPRKAESIYQGATPGRQCMDLAGTSPKNRMCGTGACRELVSHQDQGHCWVFPGEPASPATVSDRQIDSATGRNLVLLRDTAGKKHTSPQALSHAVC